MDLRAQKEAVCEEKKRLLMEYDAATQTYFRAMSDLRGNMGTSPKDIYDQLFQATEVARAKSETARAALLEHMQRHKC